MTGWAGPGFLAAGLICGALAVAVLALGREVRGVQVDPTRPSTFSQRLLLAARSPATASRFGAAVVGAAITLTVTRWMVAAAAVGVLIALWPNLFGGSRVEEQQIVRLEALVVFTEGLRDTISAHASLEQAIPAVAGSTSPVLRPALVRLVGQVRARVPMDKALLGLAAELDDPSADMVIAALILNVRRRGDRLGEVLTGLAAAAREELEMRRRITAGRVEVRRGVQIVIGVTIAMAAFLALFSRSYIAPYSTPAGQLALAVVAVIFAAGFAWLRALSGHQPAEPFLARPDRRPEPGDAELIASLAHPAPAPSRRVGVHR